MKHSVVRPGIKKDMEIYLRENLRYLRKKSGLSQAQLAQDLGITRNMLVSYETTKVEPKFNILLKISSFFEVRVSSLLKRQISDESIEEERKYYKLNRSHIGFLTEHVNEVDTESLQNFVGQIGRLRSIYSGLQALYIYKEERGTLDPNSRDLMLLIEEILKVCGEYLDKTLPEGYE